MRSRLTASIAVATIVSLLAASPASASREAGDDCVANAVEANRTMIPWESGPDITRLSRSIEEGPIGEGGDRGVVTGWKIRVAPGQASLPQRLEIYRLLNEGRDARQEAQTQLERVHEGENFFAARIPVLVGAYLGLYGPDGTFACDTGEPVVTGTFEGSANVGEVRSVADLAGFRTPVTVVVERDEDGDGYGDETQDGCYEYASIHTACPFVRLTPSVTAVTKRAIHLNVSTGDPTRVQVSGQVRWRPRPKSRAHAANHKARRVVALTGSTQEVPAGATVTFAIPFPKAVRRKLRRLEPKEKVKARLSLIATDLVGHQTATHLIVRLPGPEIVVSKQSGP